MRPVLTIAVAASLVLGACSREDFDPARETASLSGYIQASPPPVPIPVLTPRVDYRAGEAPDPFFPGRR